MLMKQSWNNLKILFLSSPTSLPTILLSFIHPSIPSFLSLSLSLSPSPSLSLKCWRLWINYNRINLLFMFVAGWYNMFNESWWLVTCCRFEWTVSSTEASVRTLEIGVKNAVGVFSKSRTHIGQVYLDLSKIDLSTATTDWWVGVVLHRLVSVCGTTCLCLLRGWL